jgi:hypothetical protein
MPRFRGAAQTLTAEFTPRKNECNDFPPQPRRRRHPPRRGLSPTPRTPLLRSSAEIGRSGAPPARRRRPGRWARRGGPQAEAHASRSRPRPPGTPPAGAVTGGPCPWARPWPTRCAGPAGRGWMARPTRKCCTGWRRRAHSSLRPAATLVPSASPGSGRPGAGERAGGPRPALAAACAFASLCQAASGAGKAAAHSAEKAARKSSSAFFWACSCCWSLLTSARYFSTSSSCLPSLSR